MYFYKIFYRNIHLRSYMQNIVLVPNGILCVSVSVTKILMRCPLY